MKNTEKKDSPEIKKEYKIELASSAVEKQLDKVPDDIYSNVDKAIQGLRSNPRPHGVKKLSTGGWRIKIASYRILYEIDDDKTIVKIYRVKHRKEAYREGK